MIKYLMIIAGSFLIMPQPAAAGSTPRTVTQSTARAISRSFIENGGVDNLGEPTAEISVTKLGCAQTFVNDEQETALIAPGCGGQVYKISPKFWDYVKTINQTEIGLPAADAIQTNSQSSQRFVGGSWGETVLISDSEGKVFALRSSFKTYYDDPINSARLGLPIKDQYAWQGEIRQDFENGILVWRPEAGMRELPKLANGQLVGSSVSSAGVFLIPDQPSVSKSINKDVPSCRAENIVNSDDSAPNCISETDRQAVAWAKAELNSKSPAWSDQLGSWWSGKCETFVEIAFGTQHRAYSAYANYNFRKSRDQIRIDSNPPAGAMVFYGGSNDGHIGISTGDGWVISTQGYAGDRKPVWKHRVSGLNNPYLGWAQYDGTWPN